MKKRRGNWELKATADLCRTTNLCTAVLDHQCSVTLLKCLFGPTIYFLFIFCHFIHTTAVICCKLKLNEVQRRQGSKHSNQGTTSRV